MTAMVDPEPAAVALRGERRWLPAIWGGGLSLVTFFPALWLIFAAGGSDAYSERLTLFCLYPTVIFSPLLGDAGGFALFFGQFLLYGIILSLPTQARGRRLAKFGLLGVHLALVAGLLWFGRLR